MIHRAGLVVENDFKFAPAMRDSIAPAIHLTGGIFFIGYVRRARRQAV